MISLVHQALYSPTLIAQLPIESDCFISGLKKQFTEKASQLDDWKYKTPGFLEVQNQSRQVIKCSNESINPDMTALFAAVFTSRDLPCSQAGYSTIISFEPTVLFERNYTSTLCYHFHF